MLVTDMRSLGAAGKRTSGRAQRVSGRVQRTSERALQQKRGREQGQAQGCEQARGQERGRELFFFFVYSLLACDLSRSWRDYV